MRELLALVVGNVGRRLTEWAELRTLHGETLVEWIRGGWDCCPPRSLG